MNDQEWELWFNHLPLDEQARHHSREIWRDVLNTYLKSNEDRWQFDAVVYQLSILCQNYIQARLSDSWYEEDETDDDGL